MGARPASKRSRNRIAVSALAMVVIVAAVVIGVVSTRSGQPAPGAGIAPAAFVVSSTRDTLAQHTADFEMSGSVSANGHSVPLQGTGKIDFDTHATSATATISVPSHPIIEHVVSTGGNVYLSLTEDGHSFSELTGGPNWVQVPLPDQNSIGAGNFDPLQQIQFAAKEGAKVVPLGQSVVNGTTVSGFAVTPSQEEIQQTIEQEVQSGALTQDAANKALAGTKLLGSFTSDLYIDGNNLLRQVVLNVGGGTSGATGKVVETLETFGTPVSVEAPPNNDVISFNQFVKDAEASGGSLG